jgi:DNA polymerase-3 subunit beta
MKFRSEQGILAEALGALARIASTRNAGTPALSGVKMQLTGDTLALSSTDNDIALQFTVPVGGEADGTALVNARLLNEIVRSLPAGKITVHVSGDTASLSSGRSQFTVHTLNDLEFPRLSPAPTNPVTLPSKDLKEALSQVVRAASDDANKQNLTAVLLSSEAGAFRLVATDGFRLAVRDLPDTTILANDSTFLIPSRAFIELQRLLDLSDEVAIRFGELETTFESPNMQLTTRLINATYPQYKPLIESSTPNKCITERVPFMEAIRRSQVFAKDNTPVRITMNNDGIRLMVQTTDGNTSVEDVDASYNGEEITLAFNPAYLHDGADAITSDEMSIETSLFNKPAVLRGVNDPTYLYLLMPQRI